MVTPSPDISCSTSSELTRYRVGRGTRLKLFNVCSMFGISEHSYPWIFIYLPADHAKAEDEAEVGQEDEEADQHQAHAADDLVPGDGVKDQVLRVCLKQGMMT